MASMQLSGFNFFLNHKCFYLQWMKKGISDKTVEKNISKSIEYLFSKD